MHSVGWGSLKSQKDFLTYNIENTLKSNGLYVTRIYEQGQEWSVHSYKEVKSGYISESNLTSMGAQTSGDPSYLQEARKKRQ